ncbi:hypothetical protein Pmani_021047 [Petrolisthes manimaculis]|uniref:Uncharacterized protein n=1 Tax=Petrolisthes manimaculis TaxID=1843537 RepID=A0AAE1PH46_9EUCA|nr:hypothetical protein Pmani_021047 [Petrolisthes manimaculis]
MWMFRGGETEVDCCEGGYPRGREWSGEEPSLIIPASLPPSHPPKAHASPYPSFYPEHPTNALPFLHLPPPSDFSSHPPIINPTISLPSTTISPYPFSSLYLQMPGTTSSLLGTSQLPQQYLHLNPFCSITSYSSHETATGTRKEEGHKQNE